MWSKIFKASNHGLVRGVAIYSVTWPLSSVIQQSLKPSGGDKRIDVRRAAKFSVYGGLYVAPTLYAWMRFASYVWPSMTITSHITKALVEQFSYGPFATASFFFFMTLLDGGTVEDAKLEVQRKFVSTWKIAIVVWPVLQTINYCVIPVKNRLIFVSFAGLVWTTFLAFMKYEKNKPKSIVGRTTK